ncbi:MAG: hypothetical protein KF778_11410 [Rhodocyclaceae bacterium]|nr:hypothetical protein [Rhodocyclaceae bacterium]MBX3669002.1 hypothetical protein [Rhodocyclaceae bacterium]
MLRYDTRGNLTDAIRTASGYSLPSCASAECAIPPADKILAWSKNSYDAYGNLTTSQRVKNFAAVTGPSVAYTCDATKWNAVQITRSGIQNADTAASSQSATLTYDSLGRLTAGIDGDWQPTRLGYDALDRVVSAAEAKDAAVAMAQFVVAAVVLTGDRLDAHCGRARAAV